MAYRLLTLSLVLTHYNFHMFELKRSLFNIFSHDCCCQCAEAVQPSVYCDCSPPSILKIHLNESQLLPGALVSFRQRAIR